MLGPSDCGWFQRGGRIFGCFQLSAKFAHQPEGSVFTQSHDLGSIRWPDPLDCGRDSHLACLPEAFTRPLSSDLFC